MSGDPRGQLLSSIPARFSASSAAESEGVDWPEGGIQPFQQWLMDFSLLLTQGLAMWLRLVLNSQ